MSNFTAIKIIRKTAKERGWAELCHQDNIKMLSFTKDKQRINIYYSKMTVGTCVRHPKFGKTQLFRKRVSYAQLEQIFDYPRVHTGKGYYLKKRGDNGN